MVSGTTSSSGYLELQFPFTPMNSTEYITVLSCSLVLFLRENNEKIYIFQQNNVRIYGNSQSVEWFRNQSIEVLLRPVCSPDMNIIEIV